MKLVPKIKLPIWAALGFHFGSLLLIYTLLRIGFYFFNRSLFDHISLNDFGTLLAGGLKFDISALLYINALYILLKIIPFSFRYHPTYQRICRLLFIMTNSIGIAANLIDFVYFRFTLKRTSGTVFRQFIHEQNLLKLCVDFFIGYWYIVILLIVFIYLLIKLYTFVEEIKPTRPGFLYYSIQIVFFVVSIALAVIGIRGGWRHSTRPITLSNAGEYVKSPVQMAIVLNTPFSIFRTLGAVKLNPVHFYQEETLSKLYTPIHLPKTDSTFKKLNVVFLIIESLGKENIGSLNRDLDNGHYKGFTPFVDSLIANGYTFTASYANGRKSIDALPSIITSIPSIREPYVLSVYSGNKTSSLAELLNRKGYETAFFHGAPNGSMGFAAFTKMAGFQHYFGKTEYHHDEDFDGTWGIWDEPFMQFMAGKINTFHQPFFATFFSLSSHHPFKVPEKYKGKFPKGPLEVQEPIGYTDMAIRKFFQTAATMSWFKNTLFVLCADHATVTYHPEYNTIPGSFSIPIVFYYPGGQLKGQERRLIQQIDIMPTVLNFLHYDQPYFAFGFDAFDHDTDHFVVNNNDGSFNFYMGDYLLINDGEKSKALYQVTADRLLQHNLISTMPQQKKQMEERLKAFIQQYNNRMINDQLLY